MTGAQPPQDLMAEQSVIGSALMSKTALNELAQKLEPADFYKPANAQVWAAIIALAGAGEPVDAMTVARALEVRGELSRIGGAPYLLSCIEVTPSPVNALAYAQIVTDKAKLRRMDELGTRLKSLAYTEASTSDDIAALLSEGEQLFRQQHQPASEAVDFGGMVSSWEAWQANDEAYIKTPWPSLNEKLNGGLQRGRLYTIGARPGVGKSVAALQIVQNAAFWGFPSAYFTLEMSKDEVMSRLIASGAGVDFGRIMRKQLNLEDRSKVDSYLSTSTTLPLQTIDRASVTVEQIVAHCRTVPKLAVVAVDYLQLLRPSDSKASREQQVSHMSRQLKIAARELNVAMVACSQLNRGPLQGGKPRAPTLGDLRESGAIEQDSDVVMLLHADEDDPGILQMIIAKNRNGRMGDVVAGFEGHYQRIVA